VKIEQRNDYRTNPGKLSRHEILLPLVGPDELGADFFEDAGETYVWLPRQVFQDMGSPTQITVTVVPGDALNEAGDS